MKNHYTFISDEDKLRSFLDKMTDPIAIGECYVIQLWARKSLYPDLKGDSLILTSFAFKKSDIIPFIHRMECSYGGYMLDDLEIPQSALAVYISVGPRNMESARVESEKRLTQKLENESLDGHTFMDMAKDFWEIVLQSEPTGANHLIAFRSENRIDLDGLANIFNYDSYFLTRIGTENTVVFQRSKVDVERLPSTWLSDIIKLGFDGRSLLLMCIPGCSYSDITADIINY